MRSHWRSHCLRLRGFASGRLPLDLFPPVVLQMRATPRARKHGSNRSFLLMVSISGGKDSTETAFRAIDTVGQALQVRVRPRALGTDGSRRSSARCLSIASTVCMQLGVRPVRVTTPTGGAAGRDAARRVWIWLLVTACGLAFGATASAAEIWVITDREHPIPVTAGARLIELDAAARIKAELSSKLPSDPAQASLIVQERLKRGGPELQARFAQALAVGCREGRRPGVRAHE